MPIRGRADGQEPELIWGGDKTGGAPYIYDDEQGKLVGFEAELADYLAGQLGRKPVFKNVTWDNLPDALVRKSIDIVLNGYEFSAKRHEETPTTLPYYVYSLRLIVPRTEPGKDPPRVRSWEDLKPSKPGEPRKRVAVLRGSSAQEYMRNRFGDAVDLQSSEDVDAMMRLVEDGRDMDASVQDSPAAGYYVMQKRLPKLQVVDRPVGYGLYVIVTRSEDEKLREQINQALTKALRSGKLKEIYEKYGVWNADQQRLDYFHSRPWPADESEVSAGDDEDQQAGQFPRVSLGMISDKLIYAALMTLALACAAMPIAIGIGILVAIGRMYGRWFVRAPLAAYVEILRGTPLLLQMFIWFYLLPAVAKETGWSWFIWLTTQPPFAVGVFALALNYSASEAENYRAGLQAIPKGQMEAALALGMTKGTAIRRVILPQAMRIVIPPVTNDFIALLKDTSICSMILITELTRLYYDYKFNREIAVELAFTIALIYLLLSYPLSLLARWLESRQDQK
jgi:polar amino acid transport system permease protein/polar amino acid transport system substrate-binding protein